MTYASEVTADAPIYRLTFDQAGSTITDTGSLPRTVTQFGSPSKANTAFTTGLSLNGTNQYLTLGSVYDFGNDTSYSIEVWFKSTQTTGMGTFLRRDSNGADLFRLNDGKVDFRHNNGTHATSPLSYADGKWHHAVGVRTATGSIALYVDGAQVATGLATSHTMTTTQPTYVGTAQGTDEFFNGTIDELAFYDTALSSTRIAAHYNTGIALINTKATPPAATMSVSAPAPVIRLSKTVSAPAMTLSIDSPAPAVKPTRRETQRVYATEDRLVNIQGTPVSDYQPDAERITVNYYGSSPLQQSGALFKFPKPSSAVVGASLHVHCNFLSGGSASYQIHAITGSWSEATTTKPTTVQAGSGNVALTSGHNTITHGNVLSAVNTSGFNGIMLNQAFQSDPQISFATSENSDSTLRPYIDFDVLVDNTPASIAVTAPAATISLAAPAPVVKAGVSTATTAPAATATIDTVAPAVSVGTSVKSTVPPVAGTLIDFKGGVPKNPDYRAAASSIAVTIAAPNANVAIREPKIVTVTGTMELAIQGFAANINLTTNKLSKVFGAMKLTIKNVGIYQKEFDRYWQLVQTTVGPEDVWFEMEETAGQVANDSVHGPTMPGDSWNPPYIQWGRTGTYQSGPDGVAPILGLDGPKLRKGAVRFDGIKQWFDPGDYAIAPPQTTSYEQENLSNYPTGPNLTRQTTVEFSIRTTQLDGVVYSGGSLAPKTYTSMWAVAGLFYSGFELRLEGGYLVVASGVGDYTTKVRRFISDGEWHHVILAIPGRVTGVGLTTPTPDYIMVDGNITARNGGDFGAAAGIFPAAFMARVGKGAKLNNNSNTYQIDRSNMSGYLAGDLRDVIVRNDYITPYMAHRLYWEWSESVLNTVEGPMTLSIGGTNAHRVRGNIKKMMLIFGLEQEWETNTRSQAFMIYYSGLSMLRAPSTDADRIGLNPWWEKSVFGFNIPQHVQRSVFSFEDFLVFPVSIEGSYTVRTSELSGFSGPSTSYNGASHMPIHQAVYGSVGPDGILNHDYTDVYGHFVNDETGAKRFIDVTRDLALPLDEWDVITVMNYPWEYQGATRSRQPSPTVPLGPVVRSHHPYSHNMTASEWTQARDGLRDSLLEALYQGASLWITEPHMAQHLGFIQSYDVHAPFVTKWGGDSVKSRTNNASYDNMRARELDKAHLYKRDNKAETLNTFNVGHPGDYYPEPQNIFYRRIVATEPGLTDMASWDFGEMIVAWPTDDWDVVNDWIAWDIIKKENGYSVGDLTRLNLAGEYDDSGDDLTLDERMYIISAKPQGIVGKVVAREQESYYGKPGTTELVANPWKDNATTIICESGTILNGRPIGGRVFIELMTAGQFTRGFIRADAVTDLWAGSTGIAGKDLKNGPQWDVIGAIGVDDGIRSMWSFDTRRYKKVLVQWYLEKWRFNKATGDYDKTQILQQWAEYQSGTYINMPFWPLPARGLHWLAQLDSVPQGDRRAVVPAMTVSLTAPAPSVSKTRAGGGAVPFMELILEIRDAKNYRSNHVSELVLPIKIDVELRGLGKKVSAPAITLAVVGPDLQVKAGGDKITVYLDREETINLFIKEDDN